MVSLFMLVGNIGYASAMTESGPVFEMQELYKGMRGPNIVVATDGSVLAFARWGELLRRSGDKGKTWSAVKEVGVDSRGRAIVDDNRGHVMVVDGRGGHLWRSLDHGKTWKREEVEFKPNGNGHGIPHGPGG